MKNHFLFVFFFLLFCSTPFKSLAANSDVVINEIAWMGTKIDEVEPKNWWRYEWLELYNNSQNPVLLDGWKIELSRTDLDYTISLKGEIPANSYFLVVASDKISNYDFNYSNLAGKLNNNGQKVVLKNNSGEIIDSIDCYSTGKWFGGGNDTKQTMERINPLVSGNEPSNWQTSENPGGTPKAANSTEQIANGTGRMAEEPKIEEQSIDKTTENSSQLSYPTGVVFNEILPSPEGADETEEWFEIHNNNSFEVDLSDWKIQDTEGTTVIYIIPDGTKIEPNGFLVLTRPKTKITLNNTGDKLELLQPDENIADSIEFGKSSLNLSYNRIGSSWEWSNRLTPGEKNIVENNSPAPVKTKNQEQSNSDLNNKVIADLTMGVGDQKPFSFLFFGTILLAIILVIIFFLLKTKFRKKY